MAKSILQDIASTIVGTISEVEILHKIESIMISYDEVVSFKSKETEDALLTFKMYLSKSSNELSSIVAKTNITLDRLSTSHEALGKHTLKNIASIIKNLGVQYKAYNRFYKHNVNKINQLKYTNTLSQFIGPSFVTYSVDSASGYSEVRKDDYSGVDLIASLYLYLKDAKSESIANMHTTNRSFSSNLGLFHGLNSIVSFDTISKTLYLGESSDTNISNPPSLQSSVRQRALINTVLPDGENLVKGNMKINKNLKVDQTLNVVGEFLLESDLTINNGDIIVKNNSSDIVFHFDTSEGSLLIDESVNINGNGLSNTDNALHIGKGSITLDNGDINSAIGNLTLSKGNLLVGIGNIKINSGGLELANGDFKLNGNQYIDNAKGIFINKPGQTGGVDASARITNNSLYIARNDENLDVRWGSNNNPSLISNNSDFKIYKKFTSESTSVAMFGGKIVLKDGLTVNDSGNNVLFNVSSSGDLTAKSLTLSERLKAYGNSEFENLRLSGTLKVEGTSTLARTTATELYATGISAINGCLFNGGGIMTGTATAAYYADVAEYYTTDDRYDYGSVLQYSDNIFNEGQLFKQNGIVLGVVSHKPGTILNAGLADDENTIASLIVLKGRSPVKLSKFTNPRYLVNGNIVVACDRDLGTAEVISNYDYTNNILEYSSKYIGRVINKEIIEGRIEVKF